MGNIPGVTAAWPEEYVIAVKKPHALKESEFDPLYGFPNGREKRVMIATEDELESAMVPPEKRDYCAHLYLKFLGCRRNVYPYNAACAHELHTYMNCEYEDYIMRIKEFERDRRLQERKKRIEKRRKSADTEMLSD